MISRKEETKSLRKRLRLKARRIRLVGVGASSGYTIVKINRFGQFGSA